MIGTNTEKDTHDWHKTAFGGEAWRNALYTTYKLINLLSVDMSEYDIPKPALALPSESTDSSLKDDNSVTGELLFERKSVIDVGCIDLIKQGRVKVIRGKLDRVLKDGAVVTSFPSGENLIKKYDAIILATVSDVTHLYIAIYVYMHVL